MRITSIETLCLSRLHERELQWFNRDNKIIKADCAIVVIDTDEGLRGIGEASPYGWPLMIQEWVAFYAQGMIGKSPGDRNIVPHPNGRSHAHDAAVGGIDCALWDLKGRIGGVRTSDLLCEAPLDRVQLYASGGVSCDWRYDTETIFEDARSCIEAGFAYLKYRIGSEWTWDGVTVDRFLGLAAELAQEVDGRLKLAVDANCRLSEEQALPMAIGLEELGYAWFEEPTRRDPDAYARLCAAVEMPISGGEGFTTLEQFRPFLEKRAYDIVQPDAAMCGITECLRIGQMAQRYGVDLIPHSWHNGLMCVEHAHMVAALPKPRLLELCVVQGPLQWEILRDPPKIENGWLTLPDGPGLGVELAPDLEEQFPYIEGHYALKMQR